MRLELIATLDDDTQLMIWKVYIQELRTRRFHRFIADTESEDTCDVFFAPVDVRPPLRTLHDARCWIFRGAGYGVSTMLTYRGAERGAHQFSLHWIIADNGIWFGHDEYTRTAGDEARPVYRLIDLT
jgi:hypothetical protein